MGLLDSLKQEALDAAKKYAADNPQLGQEAANLIHTGPNGLSGFVQQFESAGFKQIVQSWVGTGPNQAITAQQIQQVLGSDKVKQIAARIGLDPNVVSQKLATIVPQIVDHLTPKGQIPQVAAAPAPQAAPPA